MTQHHEGAKREARRDDYDAERRAAQPARRARSTGYRTDSPRHVEAREKVDPARRAAIARMGGEARAATFGHAPRRSPQQQAALTRPARRQAARQAAAAGIPPLTSQQKAAARAARAAASRPARRAAAKLAKLRPPKS